MRRPFFNFLLMFCIECDIFSDIFFLRANVLNNQDLGGRRWREKILYNHFFITFFTRSSFFIIFSFCMWEVLDIDDIMRWIYEELKINKFVRIFKSLSNGFLTLNSSQSHSILRTNKFSSFFIILMLFDLISTFLSIKKTEFYFFQIASETKSRLCTLKSSPTHLILRMCKKVSTIRKRTEEQHN